MVDKFTEYIKRHSFSELDDEEGVDILAKSAKEKANFKLRQFKRCGWLEEDNSGGFSVFVSMTDNAIALMETFKNLISKRNRPLEYTVIRFNKSNDFNVPYGHKPQRFARAYITKIVNQVEHIEQLLAKNNWTFLCQSFAKTIAEAPDNAFIYCDPPYIGRHVDYYDSWDEECEFALKNALVDVKKPFMLSTWDFNDYRKNEYIDLVWGFCKKINVPHFYHVGAKESNRNPVMEALLIYYPSQEEKSVSIFHK